MSGKGILHGVSGSVAQGEHWAMLGPNDAGKTTLLNIVYDYLWPNGGGEIDRNGEPLVNLCDLRRNIGWVTSSPTANIPESEIVLNMVV